MDNLVFHDYTSGAGVTAVDLGAVAPSSSDDTMLRVANTSTTFQAENVTVSLSGEHASQIWLSADGDSFAATLDLGDIPPDSISAPFWVRRVTPSSGVGSCTASLTATPQSWKYTLDTSTSDNVALHTPDNPPDEG